jgi:hypothetical protein
LKEKKKGIQISKLRFQSRDAPFHFYIRLFYIFNLPGIGNVKQAAVKKKLINNKAPICKVKGPNSLPGKNKLSIKERCVRTEGIVFQKMRVTPLLTQEHTLAAIQQYPK